jgi:hypothetical protein
MGYIVHHAILVTLWDEKHLEPVETQARICFEGIAPVAVLKSPVNGYVTIVVGPDGSKAGWAPSDAGDKARAEFMAWLDKHQDEMRIYPEAFVVAYGGDYARVTIESKVGIGDAD